MLLSCRLHLSFAFLHKGESQQHLQSAEKSVPDICPTCFEYKWTQKLVRAIQSSSSAVTLRVAAPRCMGRFSLQVLGVSSTRRISIFTVLLFNFLFDTSSLACVSVALVCLYSLPAVDKRCSRKPTLKSSDIRHTELLRHQNVRAIFSCYIRVGRISVTETQHRGISCLELIVFAL